MTPRFIMKAGDSRILRLILTDADETPTAPLDLTAVTAITWEVAAFRPTQWQANPYRSSPVSSLVTKTLGAGIEVDGDPADGVILVTILAADSADWAGDYRHETRFVDGLGNVKTARYTSGTETWHFDWFKVEPQYVAPAAP